MKQNYDLSGFSLIAIGTVLSMAVYILRAAGLGNVEMVLGIAATILMIAGLVKVSQYSSNLRSARVEMLLVIGLSIIGEIMAIFGIASGQTGAAAALGILSGIVLFVAAAAGVLAVCHLLYGCRDIAGRQGDAAFADRCRKAWFLYIICFIGSIVVGTAGAMVDAGSTIRGVAAGLEALLSAAGQAAIAVTAYQTCSKFHGQEIKGNLKEDKKEE